MRASPGPTVNANPVATAATPHPFADPEVEASFRLDRLPEDRRLAATLIAIGTIIVGLLTVVDRALLAVQPGLYWLLPVRVATVFLGVAAAWLAARARRPATLDTVTFCWALLLSAVALAVGPTRPRGYQLNFAFEAIIVTANWALLPNTLRRQAAAGLAHTGAALMVGALWRDLMNPVVPALGLAFLSANLVGWFTSTRLHLARRREYLERRRLGEALAEVRTLRGLIPICASCKSIRNEAGEWRRLEEYLSRHTDATLTHGLCEPCARRLYPEDVPARAAEAGEQA